MQVLFSLVANNTASSKNMLVFTTHSPYSLAITNTLIMGAKAYANVDEKEKHTVEEILPVKYQINVEDIAVYRLSTTEECYCQSVINPKTGLISKNELDSASDDIMLIFNKLYRIYAQTLTR